MCLQNETAILDRTVAYKILRGGNGGGRVCSEIRILIPEVVSGRLCT
jgi:hypothetical protein